eukprot:Gb_35707 [translate_table: standard]
MAETASSISRLPPIIDIIPCGGQESFKSKLILSLLARFMLLEALFNGIVFSSEGCCCCLGSCAIILEVENGFSFSLSSGSF